LENKIPLTALSAFLSAVVFPKINFWWISYFCLVPLIYSLKKIKRNNKKGFFKLGFLYGSIFMFVFHNWIFSLKEWAPWFLIVVLWVLAAVYFGLFYGIMAYLYGLIEDEAWDIILIPSCWVFVEWLRSLGPLGNSAGALGYSQTNFLYMLQAASIVGVFGLSFIIVLINGLIYKVLESRGKKGVISLVLVVSILVGFGYFRVEKDAFICKGSYEKRLVSIVQGNHSQAQKLDSFFWGVIRADYINLIGMVTVAQNPDIVFLPETVTPGMNLNATSFIQSLVKKVREKNFSIVMGSPFKKDGLYYNTASVISKNGLQIGNMYFKNTLMPFGEYWPLRSLIEKICKGVVSGVDFTPGKSKDVLRIKGVDVGVGICLESIYPFFYRDIVRDGADLLCVLVNNAWFISSNAAAEHLQMSVMRAVENDRFLVQAANTGISALVNNKGHVVKASSLNCREIISGEVESRKTKTFYSLFGDIIILFSIICYVVIFGLGKLKSS
jgi:apolipoprotein N-acyltransferase